MTWEEVTQSQKFQALDEGSKRKVLTGWFAEKVEPHSGYQALPPNKKEKVMRGYESAAGLPFQERIWEGAPFREEPLYKQLGRGLIKELPTAGAMFGGAIGAAPALLTGPAAIPAASVTGVAGAGLGGAAGESLKQLLEQQVLGEMPVDTPWEQLKQVGKTGVEMATAEAGGQSIANIIAKVLAPGAAKMTQEGREMLEFAKKEDLPISPDIFTKGKLAKGAVKLADVVPPGEYMMNYQRQQLANKITKMRDNFIVDVLDMPAPAGQEAFRAQAKELYGQLAEEAGGKTVKYSMANTEAYLNDFVDDMMPTLRNKKAKDFFRMIQRELKGPAGKGGGKVEWDKIQDLTAKSWSGRYGKLTPEARDVWKGFKKAVDSDIVQIDETANTTLSNLLESARTAYKDAAEAGKAAQIEKIFNFSTDYTDGKYIFQPRKFAKNLEARIPFLQRKGVSADKIAMLKNFGEKMQVAATDIERLSKSQSIGQALMKGGRFSGAGYAIAQNPMLIVPAGFDVMAAHSIMNPRGWMKQWLTEGFKPGIGTEALKQAIKPITYRYFNDDQRNKNNIQSQQPQ